LSSWLWQTLQITDIIDIALLSYLIYRALILIRGTRAVQSLIGLVALVFLYALARQLGLTSVHWVLETISVYIVLAILILFQEDIRKGLARAGSLFPRSFGIESDLPMLQELVKVSFNLSARRIGALIAIQRRGSLQDYIDAGTLIDARVCQELLLAIFHPTSPLHDGAVIIQDGRVTAAQTFLPLTRSKSVSRIFGTRHRAAIGLTETTDAVVVLVSEERGTVSLVASGQITPVSDANEMRQKLQELFEWDESSPTTVGG